MNERTQQYWENRPEPYTMMFKDFVEEYIECMNIAREKEKNGNLDFYADNYIPMTEEDWLLHDEDWKAFSRKRGFSEYDIAEYARWHKLSGQTDKFDNAINDPWRRSTRPMWEETLYINHIEKALELNIELLPEITLELNRVRKIIEEYENNLIKGIKSASSKSSLDMSIRPLDEFNISSYNESETDDDWDR